MQQAAGPSCGLNANGFSPYSRPGLTSTLSSSKYYACSAYSPCRSITMHIVSGRFSRNRFSSILFVNDLPDPVVPAVKTLWFLRRLTSYMTGPCVSKFLPSMTPFGAPSMSDDMNG